VHASLAMSLQVEMAIEQTGHRFMVHDSRLEGGVNRAKLKFTKLITTTSRVSVRNNNEFEREGAKQIAST
jgi:hypothetical protein